MNIMKTNLLLLDNKIKKDENEGSILTAPVPSTQVPESKEGMNALMFQGMQNLMANPKLAKGVGVAEDGTAEKTNAESYVAPYSSNIAFQGRIGNKAKTAAFAALMSLAATSILTSCEKSETIIPPAEVTTNVTVNVDLTAMNAMVSLMQATLAQMLQQQQLSYEQFKIYMEQMNVWQQQINQSMANLEAILSVMGDNIIDINNGVQENNAYQKLILAMLEQNGMTAAEANNLLAKLIEEVRSGNKTVAQAMQEIMDKLDLINQNLTNIFNAIKDADAKAQEDRSALLLLAKEIRDNGKASLYQQQLMIAQNAALIQQNNIIINNQKIIAQKIEQTGLSINATINEVAEKLGMKLDDLAAVIVRTGKSLEEVMKMSKSEIIAAINANTKELEIINGKLEEINVNVDNNTTTVEKAADDIINILNDISAALKEFIQNWGDAMEAFSAKLDNLTNIAGKLYKGQKFQTALLVELKNEAKKMEIELKKQNESLIAIYEKIQNNGGSISKEELEIIANKLGISINASLDEIKALIKEELTKEDKQIELLEEMNKKLSGLGTISQSILNEIQNMGGDLKGLESINAKLDELIAAVKTISAQIDNYAKIAGNAYNQQITLLNGIKSEIANLAAKLNILIAQGERAEEQRVKIEEAINNLKNQVANLEANVGRSITPEELDEILTNHDKSNQAFYADLLSKFKVEPADFTTIEALLADINAKMEYQAEANKTLLEILAAVKKLDKDAPDYNAKLDKIIELMENFKFECNCQGDCNGNDKIHEGIIGIIS